MTKEAAISALVTSLAWNARAIQALVAGSDERKTAELIDIYLEQALGRVQSYSEPDSVRDHYEAEARRFRSRDTKPSSVRSAAACDAVVSALTL
jgi:hypothetical protein